MGEQAAFWYRGVDPNDHGTDWHALCRKMQEIEPDLGNGPVWPAFADYIRTVALDQEVYGEALLADPDPLELMWSAFGFGWDARSGHPAGTRA